MKYTVSRQAEPASFSLGQSAPYSVAEGGNPSAHGISYTAACAAARQLVGQDPEDGDLEALVSCVLSLHMRGK